MMGECDTDDDCKLWAVCDFISLFYSFMSFDFRVIDDARFSACSTFGHFLSASLTGGFDMEHMVS